MEKFVSYIFELTKFSCQEICQSVHSVFCCCTYSTVIKISQLSFIFYTKTLMSHQLVDKTDRPVSSFKSLYTAFFQKPYHSSEFCQV